MTPRPYAPDSLIVSSRLSYPARMLLRRALLRACAALIVVLLIASTVGLLVTTYGPPR